MHDQLQTNGSGMNNREFGPFCLKSFNTDSYESLRGIWQIRGVTALHALDRGGCQRQAALSARSSRSSQLHSSGRSLVLQRSLRLGPLLPHGRLNDGLELSKAIELNLAAIKRQRALEDHVHCRAAREL